MRESLVIYMSYYIYVLFSLKSIILWLPIILIHLNLGYYAVLQYIHLRKEKKISYFRCIFAYRKNTIVRYYFKHIFSLMVVSFVCRFISEVKVNNYFYRFIFESEGQYPLRNSNKPFFKFFI